MTNEERTALIAAYQKKWKKKMLLLGKEQKALAEQIDILGDSTNDGDRYEGIAGYAKVFEQEGCTCASRFMKKHYGKLVELYVPKAYQADYYYIIDKLPAFPYSKGWYRRTVRSREYSPWFVRMFELLNAYKMLDFYGCSFTDFLTENLAEQIKEFREAAYRYEIVIKSDLMIAAGIDSGDKELINLIHEMILGDNNTAVVSVDVIRGILMSDNRDLHQLLSDFLLAAKL